MILRLDVYIVYIIYSKQAIAGHQPLPECVHSLYNSPSQDYTHLNDHNLPTYDMTPGFKPFTVL